MNPASRYAIRGDALKALGFACYQDYLDSDLWDSIRKRILARDHGHCRGCNRTAVSVHHITYDLPVMRGDDPTQLVSLCSGCHKFVEFEQDKKLTSTSEIFDKLRRRMVRTKASGRKTRKQLRPRCRCCTKQVKVLGRNDICMPCYKSGRALAFVQKHGVPTG